MAGLLMPLPLENEPTEIQARRNEIIRSLMGPDFPVRRAKLWQLPADAPELDQVVATLLQNARGAVTAEVIARDTHAKATEVIRQIDEYLGAR